MTQLPEKLGEQIPFDKAAHLPLIQEWWKEYYGENFGFPVECIPDTGVVVTYKGKLVAAAFIYQTNAKIAQIHYPVVDPSMGAGNRVFFLRAVIDAAIEEARKWLDGQGFIWCATDHAVVARVYRERGLECPGEADIYFKPVGAQSPEFLR